MLNPGQFNNLRIIQQQEAGVYLDAGTLGKLFVPSHMLTSALTVDDTLNVFVYQASDGEWVATTRPPLAQVGDIAWLKVVAQHKAGAFLDWGLPKDLLLPFSAQRYAVDIGHYYLVKVLYHPLKGFSASMFLDNFLSYTNDDFVPGQRVTLLIAEVTEQGIKAIINQSHWGLLYHNEIFQSLKKGQRTQGYIKQIREHDQRIDLSLYPPGYTQIQLISERILAHLARNDDFLPLTDYSAPTLIYAHFGVSKKVFKQALGALYKQRLIALNAEGIRLLKPPRA